MATVALDTTGYAPELSLWPEFHNGVAAGLRLAPGVTSLTRTWIVYNQPAAPNYSHAGLLMALGLHGHLTALAMTDIYSYLSQGHDATTVGVLLGMAVAKRGTMDPAINKMLCLHIPSLLPPPFAEMDMHTSIAQTAAILGVGLLYQCTGHRLMTEFLLAEIGRRPASDRCQDREGYSLAAGLALGMVTLGRGADGGAVGLADLHIQDRLHRYMVGGKDPDVVAATAGGDPSKCSRIREGEYVNTEVSDSTLV